MTTSPAKRNTGTIAIIGVLTVVLLVGTGLFIHFAFQLFNGRAAPDDQTAMATPEPTTAAVSETMTFTPAPTSTRTPVVIVAATAIPYTPGPMPTPTAGPDELADPAPEPEATTTTLPTETRPGNTFATAAPTSGASPVPQATIAGDEENSGESGELPQTGLGLATPVLGLLLAGLAGAARWLRRQE